MFIVTVHGKGLASRLVKSMVQAKGIPSSSFRAYLGSKAAMLQKNPSWSLHKALKKFWKFGLVTEIRNNLHKLSAEALYQSAQTPIFYGGRLFPNVALLSSTMQVWPISAASSLLHYVKRCHCTFFVCLIQNLNPWLRLSTTWMLKAETYLRLAPHSAWGSSTLHISVPAELFDPVGQHSNTQWIHIKSAHVSGIRAHPTHALAWGRIVILYGAMLDLGKVPGRLEAHGIYVYIYIFTLYMYILCMYTYECISNSCLLYLDIEVGQASELPLMKRAKNSTWTFREEKNGLIFIQCGFSWCDSYHTRQISTLPYLTLVRTPSIWRKSENGTNVFVALTFFLTQESKASDTETQWPTA